MSIGVAILGGGIFAREEHLPAIKTSKDLSIKAVWSRSLKSAQTVDPSGAVDLYSEDSSGDKNLDALLARSDVQAVIIALPIKNQPEYIKKAISAGKHVLSEKPIAENLAEAESLIKWHKENGKGVTWAVAENNRYLDSAHVGRREVQKLGRLTGFHAQVNHLVKGGKYFETPWRKVPDYQGGFLLDGGVHWTATLRYLLGNDHVTQLATFSNQVQPHLPPVDTLNAIMKLKSGATGGFAMSFGTTLPKMDRFDFAGENGSVSVAVYNSVTVRNLEGDTQTIEVKDERTGVAPEVRAWGAALASGKPNKEQSPEEALGDLELIERMLKSGESNGVLQQCTLQVA